MFIDASALAAIMLDEPERDYFEQRILTSTDLWTSAVAVWETARAMTRVIDMDPRAAHDRVAAYLKASEIGFLFIREAEAAVAVEAFARFGKRRHPADLNMGDCLAYACARNYGHALLFKGNDFSQTDLELA